MLRLKPSELTLTPDDVDDAFRRIARRQQSRPPAPPSQRRQRPLAPPPPPPRLLPGAQRSVRDAITPLGDVPVLQPQQAIIAHVDDLSDSDETDGADETDEILANPARIDSLTDVLSYPTQLMSMSTARLPFRLERSQEHADDSEGTPAEPNLPPQTTPATPFRRPNDYPAADSSPTRQHSPPPSPPSLRGGAGRSQRKRILVEEALYVPSPLRQTQVPSPVYSTGGDSPNPDDGHFLQGYFVDRQEPKIRRIDSADFTDAADSTTAYTFRWASPHIPHTEPYRRTSQPRFHSRSQSSKDAPPSRLFVPNSAYDSPSEDVFWTAAEPSPERPSNNALSGRARQHSSETSNTSLAFSYYELPDRQSSGERSANPSLSQAQQDGTVASGHASCGTYRSFKVSDDHSLVTAGDPSTSPVLRPEPQIASPLPAVPFARQSAGSLGTHLQQVVHRYVSSDSSSREVPVDALAAMVEERASPLDVLEAQIGRASHHLVEQGRHYRRSHPESRRSAYRQTTGAYDQYQPPSSINDQPSLFSSPMAMADDPYTLGVSAHTGQYGSSLRPTSALPVPSRTRGTRGQRSSENAPVGSGERHSGRSSQVQDHVSAFEQMENAAQPRHSRRTEASPAQSQPSLIWSIPQRHSSRQHAAPSPARHPRMDPRLQNQENSGEAEVEMMRQELESARMRYDEDQQGDVMDETPPRIGRVERHM